MSTKVTLHVLDNKSTEYTCDLMFTQGVNEFQTELTTSKGSTTHKIAYVSALLTDSQIEIFKKGKKFDHFIASFMKR